MKYPGPLPQPTFPRVRHDVGYEAAQRRDLDAVLSDYRVWVRALMFEVMNVHKNVPDANVSARQAFTMETLLRGGRHTVSCLADAGGDVKWQRMRPGTQLRAFSQMFLPLELHPPSEPITVHRSFWVDRDALAAHFSPVGECSRSRLFSRVLEVARVAAHLPLHEPVRRWHLDWDAARPLPILGEFSALGDVDPSHIDPFPSDEALMQASFPELKELAYAILSGVKGEDLNRARKGVQRMVHLVAVALRFCGQNVPISVLGAYMEDRGDKPSHVTRVFAHLSELFRDSEHAQYIRMSRNNSPGHKGFILSLAVDGRGLMNALGVVGFPHDRA